MKATLFTAQWNPKKVDQWAGPGLGENKPHCCKPVSSPVLFGEKEKSRAVVKDRHDNQSLILDSTLDEKNVIRAVMFALIREVFFSIL